MIVIVCTIVNVACAAIIIFRKRREKLLEQKLEVQRRQNNVLSAGLRRLKKTAPYHEAEFAKMLLIEAEEITIRSIEKELKK